MSEQFSGKRPNEVISILDNYISTLPETVQTVRIFCDNCFSQNKNHYLMSYLSYISNTKLRSVHVYDPILGHSRMPCNTHFGRIKQKKKTVDRVCKPLEWVNLIKTTDNKTPFTVKYVQHPLTDNLGDDGTPVIKVKDYKQILELSPHSSNSWSYFPACPVARMSMTGPPDTPSWQT